MTIARSKPEPSLRKSAGARFTTSFIEGKEMPLFFKAVLILSFDSVTEVSARPTSSNLGNPPDKSVSTKTSKASNPEIIADAIFENIIKFPFSLN